MGGGCSDPCGEGLVLENYELVYLHIDTNCYL